MAMRIWMLLLTVLVLVKVNAQDTIPDRWEEGYRASISYWPSTGQYTDMQGAQIQGLRFVSDGSYPALLLHRASLVSMVMDAPDTVPGFARKTRVDFKPVGERAAEVEPVGRVMRENFRNYYLPHTMPNGVEEVYGYSEVLYADIFPGIDMRFYGTGLGQKLSFICWPESNPEELMLQFLGLDSLGLTVDSLLRLYIGEEFVDLPEAVAYQVDATNEIVPINWRPNWKVVSTDIVGFEFEARDPDLPIILQIGPGPKHAQEVSDTPPCWGTLFGGTEDDRVHASATDADGNYYITGTTSWNTQFPNGPITVSYATGSDLIYVCRFDPQHYLFWTIYYGGFGAQFPAALAVRDGPLAEIYLGGVTYAVDLYPEELPGAYYDDTGTGGGLANGFLAKFNINAVLLHSTYFGNLGTQITDITLDDQGRLFVAGLTEGDVPTPANQPNGSYVRSYTDNVDGFIVGLDTGDDLRWATFVGDSAFDDVRGIRCVGDRLFAVGGTYSRGYQPILDGGPMAYDQDSVLGTSDVTIAEFDLNGALQWGTTIGGPNGDLLEANEPLAVNDAGDLYVIGTTNTMDFPVVADSGWVSLEPSRAWLLSIAHEDRSLQWSTPIAGHSFFQSSSIVTDGIGNVFVAGGIQGNTAVNLELPGFYFQEEPNTGTGIPSAAADGYIMAFTPGHWPILSTYVGGDDYSFGANEQIASLACTEDLLYAAGFTPMLFVPDTSYFPVFNPGAPAYFEEIYTGGVADVFLLGFCTDLFTAVPEDPSGQGFGTPIGVLSTGPGQWQLTGLPDGRHLLHLFDASGRVVRRMLLASDQARSEPFGLGNLAPGLYIGALDRMASRSFRILHQP